MVWPCTPLPSTLTHCPLPMGKCMGDFRAPAGPDGVTRGVRACGWGQGAGVMRAPAGGDGAWGSVRARGLQCPMGHCRRLGGVRKRGSRSPAAKRRMAFVTPHTQHSPVLVRWCVEDCGSGSFVFLGVGAPLTMFVVATGNGCLPQGVQFLIVCRPLCLGLCTCPAICVMCPLGCKPALGDPKLL